MITAFKIAKFKKDDVGFTKTGYDEYIVTYILGPKAHQLRIVVNGFITKQTINLINGNSGYKNNILLGIKEYLELKSIPTNKVVKKITLHYLEQIYSKRLVNNIKTHLININKEESRDKLTKLGFVDNVI